MSRRSWFAAMGGILGLGSPLGLLALRLTTVSEGLAAELALLWPVYLYIGIGTVLAFSLFGYILGRKNDHLIRQSDALRRVAREMRRLFITDGLTRVYTRSYIAGRLDQELQRARRYGHRLSCLFIDIDYFKTFNDRYGHSHGDRVLTAVARVLTLAVRETDIVGRYGGDEFMAILHEAGPEEAGRIAERVRLGVQDIRLDQPSPNLSAGISVSIGVYAPRVLPTSSQIFVEMADRALFMAKSSGRNRVHLMAAEEGLHPSVADVFCPEKSFPE